jgi:hypothetical protein
MHLLRPSHMRGPTVPEGEEEFHKFDFAKTFDCPPFTAMLEVHERDNKGKPIKTRQGKVKTVQEIHTDGRPNSDWLKKHRLTKESKSSEWFEALLPLKCWRPCFFGNCE